MLYARALPNDPALERKQPAAYNRQATSIPSYKHPFVKTKPRTENDKSHNHKQQRTTSLHTKPLTLAHTGCTRTPATQSTGTLQLDASCPQPSNKQLGQHSCPISPKKTTNTVGGDGGIGGQGTQIRYHLHICGCLFGELYGRRSKAVDRACRC